MNANKLTLENFVLQSQDQVSCNLDNEIVLLNIDNGDYYNFDDITSEIWSQIPKPTPISSLVSSLRSNYNVSQENCERDVLLLLSKLVEDGLVKVEGGV